METEAGTTGRPGTRDWKAGLVVFGIFEILLGAFCALMVPLMVFGMVASAALGKGAAPSMSVRTMIPSALFYVLLATWLIWMGIGSIQARRWARALLLVTAWIWLVSGVMGLVFMLMFLPGVYGQMATSGQMPQAVVVIIGCVTIAFMAVFYVIVPGALVLFYGSRHTKATCEQRDACVRWTDRCPLPVLALSLIAGCGAVCMPLLGFYGWAMPFFGVVLGGIGGAAAALAVSLLLVYVAWGTYRLRVGAWWCAVLLVTTWAVSTGVTFSRVGLMALYERMGFPDQQLEIMRQVAQPMDRWMLPLCGLWGAIALAYLFYTRRFFTPPAEQHSGPVADRA